MRRAPWPSVGGSTMRARPLRVSMRAMWLPASDAYQTAPARRGGDPVRPRSARRVEQTHPARPRIEPAVHAGLAGEPQPSTAVERGGVEVRAGAVTGQREPPHAQRAGVHPHDRVQAAVRNPRRTVGADDHTVRCRARSERDPPDPPGAWVKAAQLTGRLGGEPDLATRRGRHVVGAGTVEHLVLAELHPGRAGGSSHKPRPLIRLQAGDHLEAPPTFPRCDDHRLALGQALPGGVIDREVVGDEDRVRRPPRRTGEQLPQPRGLALAGRLALEELRR